MFGDSDERTPLLQDQFSGQLPTSDRQNESNLGDAYTQFCLLVGNSPADQTSGSKPNPPRETLYYRTLQQRKRQALLYALTRALTNTLLLSQVVLGAVLTGLGAADSPGWLITIFGAANTVIAGLVAFLKSRGQPMRARMFKDDLDRVVDEIENSATMWRGISQGVHGYDAIDTDDAVTVRSEVARLTRLYDRAVKTNTMNDPDHYGSGISLDNAQRGLKARSGQPFQANQPPAPATGAAAPAPIAVSGPSADLDQSPATQIPPPLDPEVTKDPIPVPVSSNDTPTVPEITKPSPPAAGPGDPKPSVNESSGPPTDPDASPATAAKLVKAKDKSEDQPQDTVVEDIKSPEVQVNAKAISP